MKISVIITTYNRKHKLSRLIESILTSDLERKDYEIIVVDDFSTDGTIDLIKQKFASTYNLRVIEKKENKKKSHSVNLGVRESRGDYLFFIDDDTIVDKNTIRELYSYLVNNKGNLFVCPIMYFFDNKEKIWSAGLKMNLWTTIGNFIYLKKIDDGKLEKEVDIDGGVTSFMVPKRIFSEIGFFNEKLFPFQFEELDYCVRANFGGYKLKTITTAKLWHDHEYGIFLNNPWRLYFAARNRTISAKLWSKNGFQIFVSQLFSIAISISYLGIKLIFFREKYWEGVKSIFKGIKDGLKMSSSLTPYYKRDIEALKEEVF